jgi:hypothetical protein
VNKKRSFGEEKNDEFSPPVYCGKAVSRNCPGKSDGITADRSGPGNVDALNGGTDQGATTQLTAHSLNFR